MYKNGIEVILDVIFSDAKNKIWLGKVLHPFFIIVFLWMKKCKISNGGSSDEILNQIEKLYTIGLESKTSLFKESNCGGR